MTRPPRPFKEPWHAEVFALTVALNERAAFSWPEWTTLFSAKLAARPSGMTGDDGYYLAWIDALETMLARRGLASPEEAGAVKDAWRAAYLNTPHGRPVRIPAGQPTGGL